VRGASALSSLLARAGGAGKALSQRHGLMMLGPRHLGNTRDLHTYGRGPPSPRAEALGPIART